MSSGSRLAAHPAAAAFLDVMLLILTPVAAVLLGWAAIITPSGWAAFALALTSGMAALRTSTLAGRTIPRLARLYEAEGRRW